MARVVFEEQYQIVFATAINDISAPTVAEMGAATDLTSYVTKDGVKLGSTNNRVAADSIATAFDAEIMGSHGNQVTITFLRDDTTDDAWDTLSPRLTQGFIVIAPFAAEPYDTAGSPVYVFPVETGSPILKDSAKNERQTWDCDMAVTAEPAFDAVIAA